MCHFHAQYFGNDVILEDLIRAACMDETLLCFKGPAMGQGLKAEANYGTQITCELPKTVWR